MCEVGTIKILLQIYTISLSLVECEILEQIIIIKTKQTISYIGFFRA